MDSIKILEELVLEGKLSEALDFIEALPQEERQQWQIQNLTGIVCAYCGQHREARTFFEAALEQRPDDGEILYNLADTYANLNMPRKALEQLEQCQRYDAGEELRSDIAALRQRIMEQKGGRVLMAAYYFPPLSGSGVFRSIKFAKYLPLFDWEPTVISTDRPPNGWNFADQSQLKEIPEGMEVVRIPDGISTGRETSLNGDRVQAILGFLRSVLRFSPEADRIFTQLSQSREGVMQLLTFPCGALAWAYDVVQYIEKNIDLDSFQVVYTTSGPSSAHLIGFYLKQKYGIPWVADYRDPWTFNPYGADYDPANQEQRLLFELESVLLQGASCNLTIEKSMTEIYQKNFALSQEKIKSITNGYDESDFAVLEVPKGRTDKFTINYSGLLYTRQRSIAPVLTAIQQLCDEKKIELSKLRFRIVGASETGNIEAAERFGLAQIMEYTGYLSHSQALQANLSANMLLLFVGDEEKFKAVYTGKFFEYLRSGRPILALAPKDGAVAQVLRESGHGEAFLSTQISEIKAMILREYRKWAQGEALELLHSPVIEQFERKALTKQLADVLATVNNKFVPLPGTGSRTPAGRGPKYLVICNGGYPIEGNLRCMFAHERVLQYKKAGLNVDVFGFIWGAPLQEYEYEGVHVIQGGAPVLQKLLQKKSYKKLLIHFVDVGVMYAIQEAGKLNMPMIIWCHGYEALPWYRCWFNHTPETIARSKETLRQKDLKKQKFLKNIYARENIHFIFVSEWQMTRSVKFVGTIPKHYQVIHNFINCELFADNPKTPEDRLHILSIKSHATKMYANDLTAKAIMELSKRTWFNRVTFELYGDGVLFEENFGELIKCHFRNVHIHRRFLRKDEMKAAFGRNGILISPTRVDSQGVTACEAMSAGLSVISFNTAAIPEFLDEDCASLCEFDNYFQLADEIEYLYLHPGEFLRKSQNAVNRVRKQCGYEATIKKEIELIQCGTDSRTNIRDNDAIIRTLSPRYRDPKEMFSSKDYWERRYATGGTSGSGSYHRLAEFKAEIINNFIQEHQITSLIEWGCGDGNQLGLFLPIPYTGYDVSKTAVELCRKKYPGKDKTFIWYDGSIQNVVKRDMALSLDVIYHLVEDKVFEDYMYNLFASGARYVCIYSNNYDLDLGAHQKNRNFTRYVSANFPEWRQFALIKNRYPFNPQDPDNTSLADFYFYERN